MFRGKNKHRGQHYGQYRAAGGKQLTPAKTLALYMPLRCITLVQNKGAVFTVFQCDAYDWWTMKQGRAGDKGRVALAEADRLMQYVQARFPNLA